MVLFALFAFHAYSARPYYLPNNSNNKISSSYSAIESQSQLKNNSGNGMRYHGGILGIKAFAAALNPREVLGGLVMMLRYLIPNPAMRQHFGSGMGMEPRQYG